MPLLTIPYEEWEKLSAENSELKEEVKTLSKRIKAVREFVTTASPTADTGEGPAYHGETCRQLELGWDACAEALLEIVDAARTAEGGE